MNVRITAEEMGDYVWLRPETVAEIKFAEWTHGDVLRHAEFVALREDKDPIEAIRTTDRAIRNNFSRS
jgi:bifunctional non-homologous end joining protein LigD